MRDSAAVNYYAFRRGIISRAIISIWSLRYLYGTKIIFCTPTARCSLSWPTQSSTEPKMALSREQSLLAGKSHSLFSQSSISARTESFDEPTMIGSCDALSSLSGSLPPYLAAARTLFQDLVKLCGSQKYVSHPSPTSPP